MRILIINPNSDLETNKKIEKVCLDFIKDEYEFDVVCTKSAPKLISCYKDHYTAFNEMLNYILTGDKYDGFVIACHGDPNLDVLKEYTTKPIIGIGEASMKMASLFGNSFAIISPSIKVKSKKIAQARKNYCNDLLYKVVETKSDSLEDLLTAGSNIVNDNIDCIVLGCANYSYADKYLEKELKIKVLDGLVCALILISGLIKYNNYKKVDD